MLLPIIPNTGSSTTLEKEYPGGKLFFTEEFGSNLEVIQTLGSPGWVIDFALDEIVEIDGRPLPAGVWRITKYSSEARKLTSTGTNKRYFFSIALRENPYTILENGNQKNGLFTAPMAYPILKLISWMIDFSEERDNDIWIESYIHLLLIQLNMQLSNRSPAFFRELKIIYEIMERLNKSTMDFPTPAELVRESGIRVFRFQKGCLALYGQSAKKVIQHLKMKTAFETILIRKKGIGSTSAVLGYDHVSNFITAFHKHFGITPAEAGHFYYPSFF